MPTVITGNTGVSLVQDNVIVTNDIVDNAVTTGKIGTGAVTTAKLDSTGIAPVVTSVNGGQLAGMRNKIINGKMEIAQRGTSFGAASLDGSYTLDRWVVGNSSAATLTVSQQLGVANLLNCARVVVGTPDTSIAAGDQAIFQQNIEGFNAYDLVATTFTISFWVRSSVTGTYCVALRNSSFDRSYIATYTINAVDNWEYKTITVAGGLPVSGGTWNFTNGTGLRVAWTLACGSTFQTTAGSWATGDFLGTSAQANFLATASNTFQLTGVQLEVGSVATQFEHRPYGVELLLCQRYYQLIHFAAKSPVFITYTANGDTRGWIPFFITMRATPSITANTNTLLVIGVSLNGQPINTTVTVQSWVIGATPYGTGIGLSDTSGLTDGVCVWGSNTYVVLYVNAEL